MKSYLTVTVFFLTIINSGNASPKEEVAQNVNAAQNEPVILTGYASEDEVASAEKFTLGHSLGSKNEQKRAIGRNGEPDLPLEESDAELDSESLEVSPDVKHDEARLIIEEGKENQVGFDYFRLDSGEPDEVKESLSYTYSESESEELSEETKQFIKEIEHGDMTVLLGTNQHIMQPDLYPDFSRRFVLQYPYKEIINGPVEDEEDSSIKPKQAPPELVLQVAKESAILDAVTPVNPSDDVIYKDILRSGNYWNSFWKEDVNPKMLRTKPKNMQSVQAKILPGSDIYELVGKLKQVSPKLLYVMNKRSRN